MSGPADTIDTDTIVAVATASGRGGIGVVRLSGVNAASIGHRICGRSLPARRAVYCQFSGGTESQPEQIDSGIALHFPAPNSFTGETVVELQGHGGPVILDMLVSACCYYGARPARAGEFTERAFLNGKIDLVQAESVADLIDSASKAAARSALRSLQGAFSEVIRELVQEMIQLRVFVEAAIDFPEEEVDFLSDTRVMNSLDSLTRKLAKIQQQAGHGALLRDGMHIVIAGKPNAGKSSLLNALAGEDTAIVTDMAGTTRDVLRQRIVIEGVPIHIIDTAGLRHSADEIEQEGIRRARVELEQADRVLLIIDSQDEGSGTDTEELIPKSINRALITHVYNKADLSGREIGYVDAGGIPTVTLSAKSGEGLEALRQHLIAEAGFNSNREDHFGARRRHLEALRRASQRMESGKSQFETSGAGELLAEDLRLAQKELDSITGEFTPDDLLGEIFSSFCIGK